MIRLRHQHFYIIYIVGTKLVITSQRLIAGEVTQETQYVIYIEPFGRIIQFQNQRIHAKDQFAHQFDR